KLKNILTTLGAAVLLIGGLILLNNYFGLMVIPSYFFQYLDSSVVPCEVVLTILITYAIVEEFLRKILIEGLNEVTIWPNWVTVIISGIFSVLFSLLVFFYYNNLIVNG